MRLLAPTRTQAYHTRQLDTQSFSGVSGKSPEGLFLIRFPPFCGANASVGYSRVPTPAPQCYIPEMSTHPFICTDTPQQQPAFEGSQHQGLSESVHGPTEPSENPFDPSMDSESSLEGSLWYLGPCGIDKQPILSQTFDFFPHLDTLGGSMDFGA